jgi:hypothetical protein
MNNRSFYPLWGRYSRTLPLSVNHINPILIGRMLLLFIFLNIQMGGISSVVRIPIRYAAVKEF